MLYTEVASQFSHGLNNKFIYFTYFWQLYNGKGFKSLKLVEGSNYSQPKHMKYILLSEQDKECHSKLMLKNDNYFLFKKF